MIMDAALRDYITLIVAVLTLFFTVFGLYLGKRAEKNRKREKLARKEAQLRAMEESSRYGIDHIAASSIQVQIAALRAEIDELKRQS